MTDVSQTQLEADTTRVEFPKPKTKIRVGSWNVRTLHTAGKFQQVLREMESYSIIYYGQTDHQHRGGVAIIINRKVEKYLLDWKPISDRLIRARFNPKFAKLMLRTNRRCRGGDQG